MLEIHTLGASDRVDEMHCKEDIATIHSIHSQYEAFKCPFRRPHMADFPVRVPSTEYTEQTHIQARK